MHFRIEQRFELPLEAVEDALCDPAFIERMAELPKLGHPKLLTHEIRGNEVHQRVRYAFAGELSSAVRAVVDPARLTWVEESTMDRAVHRTTFRILPDHYAHLLCCRGTFTLTERDGESERVADGDISVSVPFVGRKVERAIVSGLEEHASAEVELMEAWAGG